MNEMVKIYARLFKALNVQTQAALGKKLNITQPSISKARKDGRIPQKWLDKALTLYNVNPQWVMQGLGPRLLSPASNAGGFDALPLKNEGQASESLACLEENTLSSAQKRQVFSCQCKYEDGVDFPELIPLFSDFFPQQFAKEHLCILYYELPFFEPTVMQGAYVAIDTQKTYVHCGKIYAIFSPLEGLSLKRVLPSPDDSGYILRVDNDLSQDIILSKELLEKRLFGQVVWVCQYV